MQDVTRIGRDGYPEPDGTDGVSRQVIFETDDTIVIRSSVAGGVSTGWHHNGDRHVFGYITNGSARLEYGLGGENSVTLVVGDFVYIPPRTVRRVVNPMDEDWIVVINFVGSGQPVVNVEGPEMSRE